MCRIYISVFVKGQRGPLVEWFYSLGGELENMRSAVSYEAKVLGGCYCKERVVVGAEGEGIGVEGECQKGVWHE